MKLRIASIAVATVLTAGAVLYLHLRQSNVENAEVDEIPTQQELETPKRGSPTDFPKTVVVHQKPVHPGLSSVV